MAYIRKTRDTWQLHVNYGQGWEHETTEDNFREVKQRAKEYRENCPQYPCKIVAKRERIEA
jgi:hypothetical protein